MNKQRLLIPDAYHFSPLPPKPRESVREKLYRFFFGDDIFISYARSDAIKYVPSLAAQLAAKNHICFFDQLIADPNEDLPIRLQKKILRSTVFVLIGTNGAVASSFVRKEIELFRSTRRPFIPVDVDGALAEANEWRDVIGVAKIREQGERVRKGDPSPEIINLINDSFRYTRRNQLLRSSLFAGISMILVTMALSIILIRTAKAEASAIKQRADSELFAANIKVDEAQNALKNITTEVNRLKDEAFNARTDADRAIAKQTVAEHAMLRAQSLERQSIEHAAEIGRRVDGARAALLAREPGMEGEALGLAVQAAEESLTRWRDFPDEVMEGVTAAVNAADYSFPLEEVDGHGVTFPIISPNAEKILGAFSEPETESTRLVLWNTHTRKKIANFSIAGAISLSAFSRDSRRLATLSFAASRPNLVIWDFAAGQPKQIKNLCSVNEGAHNLALDSDGRHVLFDELRTDAAIVTVCEIATGRKERMRDG